jgi:hypothetical protein
VLPAQRVAEHRSGAKNDRKDAHAILRSGRDEAIHAVPVKPVERLTMQALHRVRTGYVLASAARTLSGGLNSMLWSQTKRNPPTQHWLARIGAFDASRRCALLHVASTRVTAHSSDIVSVGSLARISHTCASTCPSSLVVQGDCEARTRHRVFGCICPLCGPRWFFATIAALLLLAMESPFLVVAPCASRKALRDLPQQV